MSRNELLGVVQAQLRAELPLGGHQVRESDVLRDLAGADSVRLLRVAVRLERQLGVEFSDEELFSALTVGDLADLLVQAGRPALRTGL
jgi:acyl carrier protein